MARKRRPPGSIFNVAIAAACIAGACTAAVAMTVFACLALFYWMETIAGAALAALLVSILALMLVLTMALVAFLLPKPSLIGMILPTEDEVFGRITDAIDLGRALGEEGTRAATGKQGAITLGALGIGLLLGISPSLRRLVAALLRGR